MFERFNIFIKNVAMDPRSKITDFNIKYSLYNFFIEAEEILTNNCHQYSFDEYFEILRSKKIYKGKNPFILKNKREFKNSGESYLNCKETCDEEDK